MSEARSNFLTTVPLDRLGDRRGDSEWLAGARTRGVFLAVWRRRVLVSEGRVPAPMLLEPATIATLPGTTESILLGAHHGTPCFALGIGGEAPPRLPGRFADIRAIGQQLEPDTVALLAYARALVSWHERHRHCSACGASTDPVEAGHARLCPACGVKHFPRVDPAIIVLVADPMRCLLGRQPSWPTGRYSAIAGFVEPGESLEDAVRREVHEETGVQVEAVEYRGSQPWPFPSSLMLGFTARPTGGEIRRRDGELEDARWVTRDDIAAGHILLPPPISIAWRLIEHWFDAEPGRHLVDEAKPGPWLAKPEP
jgi:NAD+ diphosphatase